MVGSHQYNAHEKYGYGFGFSYFNGLFTKISYPTADTKCTGINNKGQIVGTILYTEKFISKPGFEPTRECLDSFIYFNGSFTKIAHPDPKRSSDPFPPDTYSTGINDKGQVVGYFYFHRWDQHETGFVYHNGSFTQIGYPGADLTLLNGINDQGQMFGWCDWYDSRTGKIFFMKMAHSQRLTFQILEILQR